LPKVYVGVVEIYQALKTVLKARGYVTLVGDEGGYAPPLKANNEAVEVILEAIEKAGYKSWYRCGDRPRPCRFELYDEESKLTTCAKKAGKLSGEQMLSFG
jgi:enolase